MYSLIITIHVIACLILIAAILLQTGKGGGLSDMLGGGGSSQTLFGTRASTFLLRATTVAAITFLLTCITLTVISSKKVKSLMGGASVMELVEEPLEATATGVEEVAAQETQAVESEVTSGVNASEIPVPQAAE